MTKYILTGVDGNLGSQSAEDVMRLADKKDLIFILSKP